MDSDWLLPVFGFAVGLLVGLTGVGGAVLMTPLLMLGLGMPASAAVGTDLVYNAITKIAGTVQHARQHTVDWSVVGGMARGSIPAVLLATGLLAWFREGGTERADLWLERGIGVMMIVAAALMLWRALRRSKVGGRRNIERRHITLSIVGALGGFLVGLTSIGSGSIILALLVLVVTLRPEQLVGTDVAHAALLVGAGAIAHLMVFRDVDMALVALLLLGSIPGVLLGSRLTPAIPQRHLQVGLATLLISTAATLWW